MERRVTRIYHAIVRGVRKDGHYCKVLDYIDYDQNGNVLDKGHEILTNEQARRVVRSMTIHMWSGDYRQDGERSFGYGGIVRFRRNCTGTYDDLKHILLQTRCQGALEIELRCT